MPRVIRWSGQALVDLDRSAIYVARRARNRDKADRFCDAADGVANEIARVPRHGREKRPLPNGGVVWHVPITGFHGIRIAYELVNNDVHILRVLPSAMFPPT